jgi:hypothetical protein
MATLTYKIHYPRKYKKKFVGVRIECKGPNDFDFKCVEFLRFPACIAKLKIYNDGVYAFRHCFYYKRGKSLISKETRIKVDLFCDPPPPPPPPPNCSPTPCPPKPCPPKPCPDLQQVIKDQLDKIWG